MEISAAEHRRLAVESEQRHGLGLGDDAPPGITGDMNAARQHGTVAAVAEDQALIPPHGHDARFRRFEQPVDPIVVPASTSGAVQRAARVVDEFHHGDSVAHRLSRNNAADGCLIRRPIFDLAGGETWYFRAIRGLCPLAALRSG